ncbi:MAG: alpha/beta fold hydrolase [Kineosporiaceae bacterium]
MRRSIPAGAPGSGARRRITGRTITLAALVLAGGVVAPLATTPASSEPLDPGGGPVAVEDPPALAFGPCPEDPALQCATLEVPVDHGQPDGATLPVAVLKVPARDPGQRLGSLVVNPGGPGGSGVDFAVGAASGGFSEAVLDRYDIVGFDPRGVDRSAGVFCDPATVAAPQSSEPPTGEVQEAFVVAAQDTARRCSAQTPADALASITSENVARDMDLLRAALGEGKLDYFGASYGSFLGATYATLFPERVGTYVLDASWDPQLWANRPLFNDAAQVDGAEETLEAYFDRCREAGVDACPLGSGDPGAGFDATVAALDAAPVEVTLPTSGLTVPIDGVTLTLITRTFMPQPTEWPLLTTILTGAEQGDFTAFAAFLDSLVGDPSAEPAPESGALNATSCNDRDYPRGETAGFDIFNQVLPFVAPRFASSGYNGLLPCAFWPVTAAPERFAGPWAYSGDAPILVVGGTIDSQTPYSGAVALTEQLDDRGEARLLTLEGVGHVSYQPTNGTCVVDAVDAYLVAGTLPAEGTVCEQPPVEVAAIPVEASSAPRTMAAEAETTLEEPLSAVEVDPALAARIVERVLAG